MYLIKFDKALISGLLLLVAILSFYLPQTFDLLVLKGHSGFAGPHMIGVSANMWETPYLTRVDKIYSDGTFNPYNHHPPVFFILQSFVLDMATNFDQKLRYSYSLAAISWMFGIVAVFSFLRYYRISYLSSSVAVSGLILAWWSKQYLFLAIYDSASILLSTGMIFAISQYEKSPSKRSLIILYLTSVFAMLMSWYVVFIIFIYGTWKLMKIIYGKGPSGLLTSKIFWYCSAMTTLMFSSVTIMYWQIASITEMNLDLMKNYMLHTTVPFDMRPQVDRNELLLLLQQLWSSFAFMPMLLIYLASVSLIKICKKQKYFVSIFVIHKEIIFVSVIFITSCSFFHLLMYRWSNIHPFIFLWLMPIFAIIFAFAFDSILQIIINIRNLALKISVAVLFVLLSTISLVIPTQQVIAHNTFDKEISLFFEDFKKVTLGKKSVVQTIRQENQSKHCPNYGIEVFLSAHPNRSFRNVVPVGYQHIVIECKGNKTLIINLNTEFSKVVGE